MLTPAAMQTPEAALAGYAAIATLYPEATSPLLAHASLAQRLGNLDDAIADLQRVAVLAPENLDALNRLAMLLEAQGRYDELVPVYDQMLVVAPDHVDLTIARATAHARLGHAEAAIHDLAHAAMLDSTRTYIWADVGSVAYSARHYQAAIAIADAGLGHGVEESALVILRGQANMALGQAEAAIEDFSEAIALNPVDYTAYHLRGQALARLGRSDEAIADLERAVTLGLLTGPSGTNQAFEAMGEMADTLAQANPDAAFRYLADRSIEHGSRDPLLLGTARVYFRSGNVPEALHYLDDLVRRGYVPALYWRGQVYAADGRTQEAIADLQTYLTLYPAGLMAEDARNLLDTLGSD